ncbi:transcriptional regulator [Planotetraspora phitsanulokensis]|uniref:Transcriptional regulator n=2 Tax=Planotetraspora phitsanulokensis TaxID=575192 RepID=A0A8J3XHI4_9ACTN|nr:transcriptional regulator [Planotetraspora phitsanulokensis]
MLAGVSTDYYVRLEQGRDRHPSDQVLDALARVLRLDREASEHMFELARPRSRVPFPAETDRVDIEVARLIQRCGHALAFVVNRWGDVLAINPLATAFYEGMDGNDNLLRMTFLNPASREFYRDWEQEARAKVAHLRAVAGSDYDDPVLVELVGELSAGSEEFRRMWARHEVHAKTNPSIRFRHPEVGAVTIHFQIFDIPSDPGQKFIVGQATPGSSSDHALARLRVLVDDHAGA